MKTQKTLKALVLSLAIALGMLLPATMQAQTDGFFRGGNENYENRDASINSNDGTGITNSGIGENAPLGSGLLILAAAGAGYAFTKRRRNYRRGATLLLVLAMTLTFTNCKKKVETISNETSNGVQITLDVDDGSKVIVNPTGGGTFATVSFENGDVIYVGNNGHYCGYLQHNGDYFTGTIDDSDLSTSDYLHFYFIGNKGELSEPTSVSIADQTSKYPVISYAHSKTKYSGSGSYSARLQNYCAIAKFPLSGAGTTNAVYVRGMNNTVTVHFDANIGGTTGDPYTFSKEGNGTIKLHSESATEKWAIVLPQSAVTADLLADGFEAITVSVPEIERNTYHASDISSTSLTAGSKLCYSFSVDENGSVVRFSQGNLQAVFTAVNSTTKTWRFATNQYDIVGNAVANTKIGRDRVTEAGTVDLFGWVGASSYRSAYGIEPSVFNEDYGTVAGEAKKDDWGNVAISNGGNTVNSGWRTLTKNECDYLCNIRSASTVNETSNARWTRAIIATTSKGTVNGLIVIPDNYAGGSPNGVTWGFINGSDNGFTTECTVAGWEALEAAGCVFLPSTGRRFGKEVDYTEFGFYWLNTSDESKKTKAYRLYFDSSFFRAAEAENRYMGCSVRLVR